MRRRNAIVRAVKDAGFSDALVMEIAVHGALNILSNYVNKVAQTEIDFPAVDISRAALIAAVVAADPV